MMTRTIAAAAAVAAQLAFAPPSLAQNTGGEQPPVIDVHFHAMLDSRVGSSPMCPNQSAFLASDPQGGPEAPFGWSQEDCTPKLYPAPPGKYLEMITEEMKRLNVTAVVFGSPEAVAAYEKAAPGRVIPGHSFASGANVDKRAELRRLEMLFTHGGFKVMGEIGLRIRLRSR